MANIGGINYNNIKNSDAYSGGATIYANADNLRRSKYMNDSESYYPSLNVIDIDWCGAEINNTSLNTTSDLLALINVLIRRITTLENKIK